MKILALDLGRFKSVACVYHGQETVPGRRQYAAHPV